MELEHIEDEAGQGAYAAAQEAGRSDEDCTSSGNEEHSGVSSDYTPSDPYGRNSNSLRGAASKRNLQNERPDGHASKKPRPDSSNTDFQSSSMLQHPRDSNYESGIELGVGYSGDEEEDDFGVDIGAVP